MKELNAAYDCICLHLNAERATGFTADESKHEGYTQTIIVCPECGTKNRVRSPINDSGAKCGRCGSYLFREKQKRQSEGEWEHRTLCGDGACIGIIGSTGRCTKCGKTYEEGIAADKKASWQQQAQHKSRSHRKKTIVYGAVGVGLFLLFLLILNSFQSPSGNGTGLQNAPVKSSARPPASPVRPLPVTPSKGSEVPIELEPVNPNRLRTGSAPYTGGIRSGRSGITVDNGTDTDAIVRVVRFRDGGQEKVRNFYVRAHDQFVAKRIPPGEYVLRVAFGTDWNSETRKFNYRKSFSETQTFAVDETTWTETRDEGEVLRTRSSKLSITLHKVLHGNFQSHPINEDEFWQ
jgi:DNA-directed RNA polymerase subunit RPC12/RpoP